ncbi:MAG: leucine-rich repeat protein [Kiritimatiellae bacterium]|nr:leucine-rich repeat protein [Kiritimatiellia bacterium]
MKNLIVIFICFFASALLAYDECTGDNGDYFKYEKDSDGTGIILRKATVTDESIFNGTLEIPDVLSIDEQSLPVTIICDNAISSKAIKEVYIPKFVKKFEAAAFGKNNITNVIFACDKPILGNGWAGSLDPEKCVLSILPWAKGWGTLPGTLSDPRYEDGELVYEPIFNIVSTAMDPDCIVTISPEGGAFREHEAIEISLTQMVVPEEPGIVVKIFYTTDGSDPDEKSSVYTDSPFWLEETATVKAYLVVYQLGKNDEEILLKIGPTASASYQFPQPNGGPYTEEVDGITWTYMVKNGSAIIERVSFEKPAVPVETAGEFVLPSELGLRSVTGIGVSAFERCRYLTKVTFPDTISTIASFAFKDCLRLKELDYQGGNPEVDLAAFDGCPLKVEPLPSIKVKVALPIEIQADDEGDIELPENWLDLMAEIHGGETWKTQFTDRFGEVTADTLKKETGKVDCAGNRLQVWQEYVAGTDPLDAESKLLASVEMTDDGPVITWTPDLSEKGRVYTIYGMKNLTDKQKATDVTAMTPGEIKAAGYRFFFMSVRLAPEEVSE